MEVVDLHEKLLILLSPRQLTVKNTSNWAAASAFLALAAVKYEEFLRSSPK